MPKTLIVHIGCHKTGTTTLQTYLGHFAEDAAQAGLVYARAGRGARTHHRDLAASLQHPDRSAGYDGWTKLTREIAEGDENGLFMISAEGFCLVPPESLAAALSDIRAAGTEVRIICYVRPHLEAIASLYSQTSKFGRITPLSDYVKVTQRNGYFAFHALYEAWAGVFGAQNTIWRPFLRNELRGQDIVSDLFGWQNETFGTTLERREYHDSNVSPGLAALASLRAIWDEASRTAERRNVEISPDARSRLGEMLINQVTRLIGKDSKVTVPASDYPAVLAAYRDDAAALDEQLFGQPLFLPRLEGYTPERETLDFDLRTLLGAERGPEMEAWARITGRSIGMARD